MKYLKLASLILVILFFGLLVFVLINQKQSQETKQTQINVNQTAQDKCIISIDGAEYDVTSLRTNHSGGDVFVCGQDNTQIFYSEHDERFLNREIGRFKVSP